MPTLREALANAAPKWAIPFAPRQLAEASRRLEETLGGQAIRQPDSDLLDRTYRALTAANSATDFAKLSSSDLKRAPWVIFERRDPATAPLAEHTEFTKAYIREIMRRQAAAPIAALVSCFLLFYPSESTVFHPIRRLLGDTILPTARGSRNAKWRTYAKKWGLLEADASARLGRRLATSTTQPETVLEKCGLRGLLADGGLAEQAFLHWLDELRDQLTEERYDAESLHRFISFDGDAHYGVGLRYARFRVRIADGLLLPFADGSPADDAMEPIKTFLLETLGDPRITGAKRWNGVDVRARQVMLGWLVKVALQDFFLLLEYAAKSDATASRHWRSRKAFWTKYLEAGHIRDAWVALGPRTRQEAREFLSREGSTYGILEKGNGVQPNHSAILLRIGDLTVTEWSHNGKFRAWFGPNRSRPKPYLTSYSRNDLIRGADDEVTHFSNWELRVSGLIYHQTGLSV